VGVLVVLVLVHDFDFFQLQSKVAWQAILDKVLQDYGPAIHALGEFTTLLISFSSIKYISQYDRISDSCFFPLEWFYWFQNHFLFILMKNEHMHEIYFCPFTTSTQPALMFV
jgi:hypothetical protein